MTFEQILRTAFSLSPFERGALVDHLLPSLANPIQKEIDAPWADEAERRMREIDERKVETIDGELVMERLRARFSR